MPANKLHDVTATPRPDPPAFAGPCLDLLAERWFFLVQANPPQNLYHQAVA